MTALTISRFLFLCFLYRITQAAQECPPGSQLVAGGACQLCPRGQFKSNSGRNPCQICHNNTFSSREGATACTHCGQNERAHPSRTYCECIPNHVRSFHDRVCRFCGAGNYIQRPGIYKVIPGCYPCSHGYYQPNPGQHSCNKCDEGTFSARGYPRCIWCPPGTALINERCDKCPPGKFYSKPFGRCHSCPAGTYKREAGQGSCIPCPENQHSLPGATQCQSCPAGQTLLKDGTCTSCPPGFFFNYGVRSCQWCSENTFTSTYNVLSECNRCPDNSFAPEKASGCQTCPKGTALITSYGPSGNYCGTCPPGSVYDRRRLRCQQCRLRNTYGPGGLHPYPCPRCPTSSGKFSLPGASSCTSCADGTGLLESTGRCEACPPGYIYNRSLLRCEKCLHGRYSAGGTPYRCTTCPDGKYALDGASECISCPEGTALMTNGKCESCPPGQEYNKFRAMCFACDWITFKASAGVGKCERCPEGTRPNSNHTACIPN